MKDTEWIIEQIDGLTSVKKRISIAEHAELKRIMPKGTPFPGPVRHDRTPYLLEFMDDMSQHSDVETTVFMKPIQVGATWSIENAMGCIIDETPGPILYATATLDLGKEWSEKRLDQMLQQSGIQHKIFSQTVKKHSRKSGDTSLSKEFPGGHLKIVGYNSAGSLRSTSFQYFFGDEIDEAPDDLKGQGSALKIAEARTVAFKAKRKIALFSTPTEEDSSKIYKAYLKGDQRRYFVPCPYCGHMQILDFHKGIVYELDEDEVLKPDSVGYRCGNTDCKRIIKNWHKSEMLERGEWRATAKAKRANYRSRHLNAMYAPAGSITWTDIVQEFLDAEHSGDPTIKKSFETLYLGWPYKERGEAPELSQVMTHRSNYASRTVPDDVLYLTLGGDVQGDRVELEVLGHGENYRTWSIDYQVIKGATDIATGGAWKKFKEKWLNQDFVYENQRGKFVPQLGFIDSGFRPDIVESFCEQCPGLYPSKGVDRFSISSKRFEIKELAGTKLMTIHIATDIYKDMVYSSLRVDHPRGSEIPPNYPSFPFDYDDKYFKGLNSEYKQAHKVGDRTVYKYHCPNGRANEQLDCRVYNLCASEVIYFMAMKNNLAEQVEQLQRRVGRKVTVREKMNIFYNHMKIYGVLD